MTNEMIAREVMGFALTKKGTWYKSERGWTGIPDFINCHNAAMMVHSRLMGDGWRVDINSLLGIHRVTIERGFICGHQREQSEKHGSICRALCEVALKAKGE